MKKNIFVGFILMLCTLVFISAKPANAAGFKVSPLSFKAVVDPGTSSTFTVKVANNAATDMDFVLGVTGAYQNENGQTVLQTGVDMAENWVSAPRGVVRVGSKKNVDVQFVASVPAGASPGTHRIALTVAPKEPTGQMVLAARLAVGVNLAVAGTAQESVSIAQWQPLAPANFNSTQTPWNLALSVENKGNVAVPFVSSAKIQSMFGTVVAEGAALAAHNLLPGVARSAHIQLPGKKLFLPGVYTAHIRVVYGLTNQVVEANTRLWYMPTWAWIVSAFLIVGATVGIYVYKKSR